MYLKVGDELIIINKLDSYCNETGIVIEVSADFITINWKSGQTYDYRTDDQFEWIRKLTKLDKAMK